MRCDALRCLDALSFWVAPGAEWRRVAVEQATQSQAAEWIESARWWEEGALGMRVTANSGGNGKISTHSVPTLYSVLAVLQLRTLPWHHSQQVLPFVVIANDVFTCRHFLMDYAEVSTEFLIRPASSRVACRLLMWFSTSHAMRSRETRAFRTV